MHHHEDPGRATTSSGELAIAPGTQAPLSTWPWAGGMPISYSNTPYTSISWGLPNVAWPFANLSCSGWGMPYVAPSMQAQAKNTPSIGSWPYPAVPNTGYNTVLFGALPYGDYSMPLGNHLTPATKEKN